MKKIKSFKIPRNKSELSSLIINVFPTNYQDLTYLEPFCGASNVLLNKLPSKEEFINDIDNKITLLLKIIRDNYNNFYKQVSKITIIEENFQTAISKDKFQSELDLSINEFITRMMSKSGYKKKFSISKNVWDEIIKALPNISKRLENVFIFNKCAINLINIFNNPKVLCYCDPPTVEEMGEDEHIKLSEILHRFSGKVVISNEFSPLYKKLYHTWTCIKPRIPRIKEWIWHN